METQEIKQDWNSTYHHFGDVKFNENKEVDFFYSGDLDLNSSDFTVSCGCTSPTYNKETKTLTAILNINQQVGEKTATINCVPTKTVFILKGTLSK